MGMWWAEYVASWDFGNLLTKVNFNKKNQFRNWSLDSVQVLSTIAKFVEKQYNIYTCSITQN